MKKNLIRALSLMLVAAMLFAFTSCAQEIRVRFVKEDGSDIDFESIFAGNGGGSAAPVNNDSNSSYTPVDNTPAATDAAPAATDAAPAATEAPANNTPAATQAPANNTPAATEAPANNPAPAANAMPTTPQAILDFYKSACAKVEGGAAGVHKESWQTIGNLNISGIGPVDKLIQDEVGKRMHPENDKLIEDEAKGSDEAKRRMPDCTLTDLSKIASATCNAEGGNYKIKIVMVTEDTPKNSNDSFLAKITDNLLYKEGIDEELGKIGAISDANYQVIYKDTTIEAVIKPDGTFVSMTHTTHADIVVNSVKILIATLKDKNGHMDGFATYSFTY